ncbi:BrnA antitoxin family protein [Antarcticirhabdus aurantiaca]|uniref:BrnA antitoxin family protein n=1 Tax=Antarcticirhabdus aurantiaca TaxID=2606717 RepID=A0ACD4NKC9_9HYPH|nr:BrnA antitoxin family protein [Antarcticirhabdus aurantiaca]WAJ27357.1 BrnA antitoxin family protein [Jeongeuplla avenae]
MSATEWVDPDDAPEWTDEMFDRADLHENGVLIRRGRPPAEAPKERITIRLDPDVAAAFRATGKGWQTRLNAALRDWLSRQEQR